MISNKQSKIIKSLQLKKYRKLHSSFFVEGKVNVLEAISSKMNVKTVFVTESFREMVACQVNALTEVVVITEKELNAIGTYKSNNFGLAVIEIVEQEAIYNPSVWSIGLDGVNDPGNLGTIIRTADWFGIKTIYCSEDCVDIYNPKVLNSTKGSFARVDVSYLNLTEFLVDKFCVSAEMDGQSLYPYEWTSGGILIMGNESHGVSKSVSKKCNAKVTIPKFGQAESLNVGVATAILCSDLTSKLHQKR